MIKMFNQTLLNELRRQAAAIPVLGSRSLSSQPPPTSSDLETNPYYSKYADKLNEAKKKLVNVAEKSTEPISHEQKAVIDGLERFALKYDLSNGDVGQRSGSGKRKKLNDIVKLDLLKDLPAEDIAQVWSGYHSKKEDCIYAVLKSEEFDLISNLTKEYPVFLYPIPRDDVSVPNQDSVGYQFFVGQFSYDSCYFTPLVYYQRYKDLAPVSLAMHYYPDLRDEKGIVLMNGEYDTKIINLLEVQCLASQFKLYYEKPDDRKKQLLQVFNKNPGKFNHLDVVKEFEASVVRRM